MRHQSGFLLREAFRGLRADRFLSLTSVITIGVCSAIMAFLLLGLVLAFSLGGNRSGSDAPLRAFTRSGFEDSGGMARLRLKLEKLGAFDSVVFVSKDDALQEFRRDFGDEMLQYLEVNPLPHSFKLYPSERPLTAARIRELRAAINGFEEVEEASGETVYLQWLDRWRLPMQAAAVLLLGFMGGALALVVHNAIKVSLYARRALVENMKYCGASEMFILTPFVLEGMLLGLGGSLLGIAVLLFLRQLGRFLFPSLINPVSFAGLSAALVAGAVAISFLSGWSTVRAFFRDHPA
jgi:cell division transport system permease protein